MPMTMRFSSAWKTLLPALTLLCLLTTPAAAQPGSEYAGTPAAELRELAEGGDAEAQYALGIRYRTGAGGVDPDPEASLQWLTRAAENNHPDAQFGLCFIHYNGNGVPRSLSQAYKWCSLAEVNGHSAATGNREVLETEMSDDQVDEAQQITREWMEEHGD